MEYQGKKLIWNYVMLVKGRELVHCLTGKKRTLDLMAPEYQVDRVDTVDIRKKILSISYSDWRKLGFSKGTLHYMKQNAKGDQPLTFNKHVMTRLNQWDQSVDKYGSIVDLGD